MAPSHDRKRALTLAFAVAVILLSASGASATRKAKLPRRHLCAHTAFPRLCKKVVRDIKSPTAATTATIKTLVAQTKEAKAAAAKHKDGNQAIQICYSKFKDALYNLKKASGSIRARDKEGLNDNLSAAVSDYGTCEIAFIDSRQINFLQNSAVVLRKTASNGLWLSTLI